MRPILLLLCLSLLLPACNSYERENNRLQEEIKMLREENEYAKAEIIGLKKELAELSAKVKAEREVLQKKFEEERALMLKKVDEEREAAQKRLEADKKKNGAAKKDQAKNNGAGKPSLRPNGGVVKKEQGASKAKEPGTKTVPKKTPDNKTSGGRGPGEE